MACLAPAPESNPFPLEDAAAVEEEGVCAGAAFAVVTDDMAMAAIKEIEEEAKKAQAFVMDMEVGFSTEEAEWEKDRESWEVGTNTINSNPVNEINYTDALLSGEKVEVDPFQAKPKEKETIGWSDVVRGEGMDDDVTAKKQDVPKGDAEPKEEEDDSSADDLSIDEDSDDDDDDSDDDEKTPSSSETKQEVTDKKKTSHDNANKEEAPVFYDWAKMRRISRLKGKRSSGNMKRQQSAPNVTAACSQEGIDSEKSAEDYYDWSQQRRDELVKTNSMSAIPV